MERAIEMQGFYYVGMSENRVYSQWNSHLVGIMISKTIGYTGVHDIFRHHPCYFAFWSLRKVLPHVTSSLDTWSAQAQGLHPGVPEQYIRQDENNKRRQLCNNCTCSKNTSLIVKLKNQRYPIDLVFQSSYLRYLSRVVVSFSHMHSYQGHIKLQWSSETTPYDSNDLPKGPAGWEHKITPGDVSTKPLPAASKSYICHGQRMVYGVWMVMDGYGHLSQSGNR